MCGEATLISTQCKVPIDTVDLETLKWKNFDSPNVSDETIFQPPLPINNGPLKDVMLDIEGMVVNLEENADIQLLLCKSCFSSVKKKKLPALS